MFVLSLIVNNKMKRNCRKSNETIQKEILTKWFSKYQIETRKWRLKIIDPCKLKWNESYGCLPYYWNPVWFQKVYCYAQSNDIIHKSILKQCFNKYQIENNKWRLNNHISLKMKNEVNNMDVYHITEIRYDSRKCIVRLKVMTSFINQY